MRAQGRGLTCGHDQHRPDAGRKPVAALCMGVIPAGGTGGRCEASNSALTRSQFRIRPEAADELKPDRQAVAAEARRAD